MPLLRTLLLLYFLITAYIIYLFTRSGFGNTDFFSFILLLPFVELGLIIAAFRITFQEFHGKNILLGALMIPATLIAWLFVYFII